MANRKIILTGGGTAGHVNPNISLIPGLKERGFDIYYVGSHTGIEKYLIADMNIPYFSVSTGKLRRYMDWENVTDMFRVVKGVAEAKRIIRKINPNIIFSKGGYVSVPVVFAGSSKKIPIVIHESDVTPGLANKLSLNFATKICTSFPETLKYLPADRATLTGAPIRQELLFGDADRGREFCGFKNRSPIITFMGGSIGAATINEVVRASLKELLKDFNIVHLCGKNNIDPSLNDVEGYAQYEYISTELKDVFAATKLIISRSGANSLAEILALRMPNILIPLSSKASRGDQISNAKSYEKSGYSYILLQEDLTKETLLTSIKEVYKKRETYVSAMESSPVNDAVSRILDIIDETAS